MIAIDLSKQQELDSDPKTIQQINFTGNLESQSTIFFIIEEAKETVLDFSQEIVKVFWFSFLLYNKMAQYNRWNVKSSNHKLISWNLQ